MKKILSFILSIFGDRFYNQILYIYNYYRLGVVPPKIEFSNPIRFNHKLIHLKMHYRHPDASLYVDKCYVKDIVRDILDSDEIIIPTLGVWNDPENIDFKVLPDAFVLKANHGSGWNIIVHEKDALDYEVIRTKLANWLRMDYYKIGREYQYDGIVPRILAEPLIRNAWGGELVDFKFFCFDGVPTYVQLDFNRFSNHQRNFYDMNWVRQEFSMLYPPFPQEIKKPDSFEKMKEIAGRLSKGFPFLRVDLYNTEGKIYFGELTFHPEGGFGPIAPDRWDKILGEHLILPVQ